MFHRTTGRKFQIANSGQGCQGSGRRRPGGNRVETLIALYQPLYVAASGTVLVSVGVEANEVDGVKPETTRKPGDYEDGAGKPFVGPAGKILDRALGEAGIKRDEVYVRNTVKHFKWEPRGKRRIHQKPNSREIAACRPWLEAELRLVKPKLLVCLGATAAQTVFGPSFRVTRERGKVLSSKLAPRTLATVHPSSLLRQPDEESRQREYKRFVVDLRAARRAASKE